MTARRFLLVVGGAIALLFAWCALPASRAARPDAKVRPAASSATARPAAVTGPQPHAPPAPTFTATAARTGIPACDDYVARTMTCDQLPDDAKIAIVEASKAWAELTAAGPQPDLEASCRATASVQGESLAAMGC